MGKHVPCLAVDRKENLAFCFGLRGRDHLISRVEKEAFESRDWSLRASNRSSGKDRKSTRLNSSHVAISYAVFCLKKKKKKKKINALKKKKKKYRKQRKS